MKRGQLWRAARRSCLPIWRLGYLVEVAGDLTTTDGAFVECGSYRGGSASVLALGHTDRHLWLFDSSEGFPDPQSIDVTHGGRQAARGQLCASYDDTRSFMTRHTALPDSTLHIVAGCFEYTLPRYKVDIGPIALLHIICDLYDSIRICFEQLFSLVVPRGIVIVDDYGDWDGCRRACDEYVAEHAPISLHRADLSQVVLPRE